VIKADEDLIAECLAGQTESFGQLVVRYQDRLYNSLTTMLGSVEDARDVAQDAFISAFEKLETFRGSSAFYSWLFRIALNGSINRHRKQRSTATIEAARENSGLEPPDPHPEAHPAFALERSERQALVQAALAELPADYRTVLVLKELEDMKYEEIAAVLDCPIGTVRSRIHRARSELRSKLKLLLQGEQV
jgi:RNA polymerase sigma-70 factor (ECF subfamily)